MEQAGAELGQAQIKLELGFTSIKLVDTGSFRMRDFFNTPYKSFQKCFLRPILDEKSSLVHDI